MTRDARGAPPSTPLSDLITAFREEPSDERWARFIDEFRGALVGVIVTGVPPDARGWYQTGPEDRVRTKMAATPDGREMILVCADPAAFAEKFHRDFNARMRGRDVLGMVVKVPECEGVLVNSAASFHSVAISRAQVIRLVKRDERPWWKFW
jgi:hypothetical protein